MKPCTDQLEQLAAEAAGTLDEAASQQVTAHVSACAGCRGELDALRSLLTSAAVRPEPSAVAAFGDGVHAAWERRQRRARFALGGLAAAAALTFAFISGIAVQTRAGFEDEAGDAFDPLEAWALTDDPLADALFDETAEAPLEDGALDEPLLLDEGTDG